MQIHHCNRDFSLDLKNAKVIRKQQNAFIRSSINRFTDSRFISIIVVVFLIIAIKNFPNFIVHNKKKS